MKWYKAGLLYSQELYKKGSRIWEWGLWGKTKKLCILQSQTRRDVIIFSGLKDYIVRYERPREIVKYFYNSGFALQKLVDISHVPNRVNLCVSLFISSEFIFYLMLWMYVQISYWHPKPPSWAQDNIDQYSEEYLIGWKWPFLSFPVGNFRIYIIYTNKMHFWFSSIYSHRKHKHASCHLMRMYIVFILLSWSESWRTWTTFSY